MVLQKRRTQYSEQSAVSLRVIVNAFMAMGRDRVLGRLLELTQVFQRADFDGVDWMLADLEIDVPTVQDCKNRTCAGVHGLSVSE
ncbi:MAG: hypothetical protein H8E63_02950 [Proteobacteria bacterium]|nr:hypothetical protein [Pseudomonadota bacterium]